MTISRMAHRVASPSSSSRLRTNRGVSVNSVLNYFISHSHVLLTASAQFVGVQKPVVVGVGRPVAVPTEMRTFGSMFERHERIRTESHDNVDDRTTFPLVFPENLRQLTDHKEHSRTRLMRWGVNMCDNYEFEGGVGVVLPPHFTAWGSLWVLPTSNLVAAKPVSVDTLSW